MKEWIGMEEASREAGGGGWAVDAPNNVVAGGLVEQLVVSTCHTSALCS